MTAAKVATCPHSSGSQSGVVWTCHLCGAAWQTAPVSLTDFLLARIAEDEADAELTVMSLRAAFPGVDRSKASRPLLECDAKRRIVERAALLIDSFERTVNGDDGAAWPDVNRREKSHAWSTLYDLAEVYADHPDYLPEWRP